MKPKRKRKPKLPPALLAYFQKQGARGGKLGSSKLTAEQRSERARKASLARWVEREPVE